jgi:hypothetical protein
MPGPFDVLYKAEGSTQLHIGVFDLSSAKSGEVESDGIPLSGPNTDSELNFATSLPHTHNSQMWHYFLKSRASIEACRYSGGCGKEQER